MHNDDLKVLNEIHKGCQMALFSLDELIAKTNNSSMVESMDKAKQQFLNFRDKVKYEILRYGEIPDEIPGIQKFSAATSIQLSTLFNSSAENMSEMIVKGNRMGEESIGEDLDKMSGISEQTILLCDDFIDLQKKQKEEFHKYLQ